MCLGPLKLNLKYENGKNTQYFCIEDHLKSCTVNCLHCTGPVPNKLVGYFMKLVTRILA